MLLDNMLCNSYNSKKERLATHTQHDSPESLSFLPLSSSPLFLSISSPSSSMLSQHFYLRVKHSPFFHLLLPSHSLSVHLPLKPDYFSSFFSTSLFVRFILLSLFLSLSHPHGFSSFSLFPPFSSSLIFLSHFSPFANQHNLVHSQTSILLQSDLASFSSLPSSFFFFLSHFSTFLSFFLSHRTNRRRKKREGVTLI